MNIDTDTQWSYWEGFKNKFEAQQYHDYLQEQIGNPEGADMTSPTKYYDVSYFSLIVSLYILQYTYWPQ